MNIREQLLIDLQKAIKNQDVARRSTLRLLRAAIANADIEAQKTLDESEEMDVISQEAKRRREIIEDYTPLGRLDLVDQARTELTIIEAYLPKQASRDEIEEMANQMISEVGGSENAKLGDLIRRVMAQLKNRADGRVVSEVVRELLKS